MSSTNYFAKYCEQQDRNFRHTVSHFISDKKCRKEDNENGEIITDVSRVSEMFNDSFVNVATDIGFNDDVVSSSDVISRHDQHPSVKHIREYYHDKIKDFVFHVVDTETMVQMIKNINLRKAIGCDNIPRNLFELPVGKSLFPLAPLWIRRSQPRVFHRLWNGLMLVLAIRKRTISSMEMVKLPMCLLLYLNLSLLLKLFEDIKSALDKGHKAGTVFMDLSQASIAYPMLY